MFCFEDQKLCGPMQTDFVGHFSSVDINSNGKYDCTWTIQLWLDPDKLIELYLVILDLPSAEECGSDYIEVTHMYLSARTVSVISENWKINHSLYVTPALQKLTLVLLRNLQGCDDFKIASICPFYLKCQMS